MIKGSKPFLIITFLMSFGLAFYFANKAFPIFASETPFVKKVEAEKNKELPLTDTNGAILEQIIGIEPNTIQLVYTLPNVVAYKVNTDSLQGALENQYNSAEKQVENFLKNSNESLKLDYIFKDKNNTKVVSFKSNFIVTK